MPALMLFLACCGIGLACLALGITALLLVMKLGMKSPEKVCMPSISQTVRPPVLFQSGCRVRELSICCLLGADPWRYRILVKWLSVFLSTCKFVVVDLARSHQYRQLPLRMQDSIAFFHPSAHGGGGGERVLWCAFTSLHTVHSLSHCGRF